MEPDDLKSTPPHDAPGDARLRASLTLPPLPDDGFSDRVLTVLPRPQKSHLSPRRLAIVLGAVTGIGFAAVRFATDAPVEFNLPAVGPEFADTLTQLTDPKLHTALGVTVVTLAFVFWRDVRLRVGL
jgi:hypothetical protein